MKDAVSPYYFTVFLLLYVKTNICSFKTVACSTELNDFTPCKAEQHIEKGFIESLSKKEVVETGHRFCEVIVQNAIRFSIFS